MSMREPAEYGNDEVPIPVFYVLEIYQDTFRHEKPVVEIHTAEPLSPISVGVTIFTKPVFQIRWRCLGVIFCRWRQSGM
jgi:hypothetical protein